jgi:hypothetical protein
LALRSLAKLAMPVTFACSRPCQAGNEAHTHGVKHCFGVDAVASQRLDKLTNIFPMTDSTRASHIREGPIPLSVADIDAN